MSLRPLGIAWLGVLGLCVGSFLTVVTARVPVGRSIVFPPSACPGCGTNIRWFDNIPVLSWIALGGRCRTCRLRIPSRYPLLELGCGVVFAVIAAWSPPLLIPCLLTGVTGLGATLVASVVHRRVSWKLAIVSGSIFLVVAALTAVARASGVGG